MQRGPRVARRRRGAAGARSRRAEQRARRVAEKARAPERGKLVRAAAPRCATIARSCASAAACAAAQEPPHPPTHPNEYAVPFVSPRHRSPPAASPARLVRPTTHSCRVTRSADARTSQPRGALGAGP
jgi:hypothetical protein